MSLKQFKIIKLIAMMILAGTISAAVVAENFLVPIIAVGITITLLQILRRRVTEVIADERDWEMGGRAALLAIQIFSIFATLLMFFLLANKGLNPSYEAIAATLAYSVCFLMLLYSFIFMYRSKFAFKKQEGVYRAIGIVLIIIVALLGARFFSGEDSWMCENGAWVEHGHPDFPAPSTICNE